MANLDQILIDHPFASTELDSVPRPKTESSESFSLSLDPLRICLAPSTYAVATGKDKETEKSAAPVSSARQLPLSGTFQCSSLPCFSPGERVKMNTKPDKTRPTCTLRPQKDPTIASFILSLGLENPCTFRLPAPRLDSSMNLLYKWLFIAQLSLVLLHAFLQASFRSPEKWTLDSGCNLPRMLLAASPGISSTLLRLSVQAAQSLVPPTLSLASAGALANVTVIDIGSPSADATDFNLYQFLFVHTSIALSQPLLEPQRSQSFRVGLAYYPFGSATWPPSEFQPGLPQCSDVRLFFPPQMFKKSKNPTTSQDVKTSRNRSLDQAESYTHRLSAIRFTGDVVSEVLAKAVYTQSMRPVDYDRDRYGFDVQRSPREFLQWRRVALFLVLSSLRWWYP
ncbi:hypothetical protein GALMADRAFT_141393 [Galerina marginata CBS 339.88]|uniref:Uncharacterized protein n=1 Tax=Galerina marginata (strain CBS 339.88) TaxID=685588 RepID=A0A067SWA2_GALM3|nr:hypothetical protein GALMADRAFT_141393 [Galerina marginata CBS 339.88]